MTRPSAPDRTRPRQARHRIAILDAHPTTRRGLRVMFAEAAELEVCGESDSLAAGLALVAAERPDVTIVDLALPDDPEMIAVRALREAHPSGRVLVFSMFEERFFAARALQEGAAGYLMKDASSPELLRAVRALARGRRYVSTRMAEQVLSTQGGRQTGTLDDGTAPIARGLTPRQGQVLHWLGQGLTVPEVARRLGMSVKTVETHCAHIKERVGLRSARDLLCYAVTASTHATPTAPARKRRARLDAAGAPDDQDSTNP